MARHRTDEVVSITTAPQNASAEVDARQRRYAIAMTIRTLCFVFAVVFSGALRWVLVVAAVLLPYFAVVMANRVNRRTAASPFETPMPRQAPELDSRPSPQQPL